MNEWIKTKHCKKPGIREYIFYDSKYMKFYTKTIAQKADEQLCGSERQTDRVLCAGLACITTVVMTDSTGYRCLNSCDRTLKYYWLLIAHKLCLSKKGHKNLSRCIPHDPTKCTPKHISTHTRKSTTALFVISPTINNLIKSSVKRINKLWHILIMA